MKPVILGSLIAGSLALEPVRQTFSFGQINLVLFALIMVDLCRLAGGDQTGVGIGVATAIKLTPGIFVLLLLVARRTRDAMIAAAVFAGCTLVGFAVAPHSSTKYWLHLSHDTKRVGAPYISNQSPFGALARLLGGKQHVGPWYVAIPLVVAIAGMATARWYVRKNRWLEAGTATGVTGLLVSPISWTHHWVWCIPAILVLLKAGRVEKLVASGAYALFAVAPLWWTPHRGGPEEYGFHGFTSLIANSFLAAGLSFLAYLSLSAWRENSSCESEVSGVSSGGQRLAEVSQTC
jgi:alpha-1,2-mannosyltransferase